MDEIPKLFLQNLKTLSREKLQIVQEAYKLRWEICVFLLYMLEHGFDDTVFLDGRGTLHVTGCTHHRDVTTCLCYDYITNPRGYITQTRGGATNV